MDQKEEDDWWQIDRSDFVKDDCPFSSVSSLDLHYTDGCSSSSACHEAPCFVQLNKTETTVIRHGNVISNNDTTSFDGMHLPLGTPEEKLNLVSDHFDIKFGRNNDYPNALETLSSNSSPSSSLTNGEFSSSFTTGQSSLDEADCFAELKAYAKTRGRMHEMAIKQKLITEQDPKGYGFLHLSPEEKRALLQEGYKLPTLLPLTKSEEDALKLSAQESRRKRKEYVNALEKRIQHYRSENSTLKLKLKDLEQRNRGLFSQLKNFKTSIEPNYKTEHHPSSSTLNVETIN